MKFPYHMWVIVVPEGGHCPFLMRPTRKESIQAHVDHSSKEWKASRRKGYRCIKVAVTVA